FMGETLLYLAVHCQSKKDVILLIENGANVNQQGELNFTPIQNACLHGNLDIIEILLKNGAKTNIKNEFGYDAKHYTSEEYHDKKKSKEIRNLMRYYKQ
ncbi:MAG: ankyrin repeat domain-containing protein, partial [Veillonella sp.]|nr:ankyrin repeat domain-containing protein [Veillonella sp.]